jgi:thioredoxin 1
VAQNVTTAEFQTEVLESETPVIVDFWADWCMPCHMVSPVLDEIAQERAGDLRLVKVDVDEEEELARRYGIVSIPTIILFKDGQPVAATIGARPKAAIEQQLGLTD